MQTARLPLSLGVERKADQDYAGSWSNGGEGLWEIECGSFIQRCYYHWTDASERARMAKREGKDRQEPQEQSGAVQ
jgi:hypothetical protein